MEAKEMVPRLRFKNENGEEFPEWHKSNIGHFYKNLRTGQTPSRSKPEYFKGDIPWITSGELNNGYVSTTIEKITEEGRLSSNLKIYNQNTFFIAITGLEAPGTRGKCAMNSVLATTNQSCLAFEEIDQISNVFLFYWYNTFSERLYFKYAQGTKQQSFNNKIVEDFKFSFPSKAEQTKIASFLSSVDEKISKLEKKKTLLETYKRGIMQKIFSQELRFKDDNGQEFPEWVLTDLGSISDIQIGEFVIKTKQNPNGKYPVYNGGKTETGYYDEYNNEGDKVIISARGANAGYVNYEKNRFWGGNSCYSIKVLNENNTIFFFQQIKHFQRKFTDYQQAANIPSVSKKDVAVFKVSVPIKKEQQKIASYLSSIDKKIEIISIQLEKTREFKKGLLQQMFV